MNLYDIVSTYLDKSSPEIARYHIYMPTARTAPISDATYAQTISFTLKSWAQFLVLISAVYAWPLPGLSDLNHHHDRNLYCLWAVCC